MLERLEIENFILIEKMHLDFCGSFCAITGESGSGKTMILKALNALRTGKVGQDWFFDPDKQIRLLAVISADDANGFPPDALSLLEDNSIVPDSGEIIFERTFSHDKVSSFIQGSRKPSALFSKIISHFVVQNYQREESRVLEKGYALNYLDVFSGTTGDRDLLRGVRSEYAAIMRRIDEVKREFDQSVGDKDFLEHAIEEISQADIKPDEDELIREKLKFARDRVSMLNSARHACDMFSHGPDCMMNSIRLAALDFESISRKDERVLPLCERMESLSAEIEDVAEAIRNYCERQERDDVSQDMLIARQDVLSRLKRKYGSGSLENVLSFKVDAQGKLDLISDSDVSLEKMRNEAALMHDRIASMQAELDAKREKMKQKAEKRIESILSKLSMGSVRFEIDLRKSERVDSDSSADFYITLNKGKGRSLLRETASGGEISRIFLAMLCACDEKGCECEVFDEIDAGLSGELAKQLAKYLKDLSHKRQIIAVTHQAVVAAASNCNVGVVKINEGDHAKVKAHVLNDDEKRRELQRIIAGDAASSSDSLDMKDLFGI